MPPRIPRWRKSGGGDIYIPFLTELAVVYRAVKYIVLAVEATAVWMAAHAVYTVALGYAATVVGSWLQDQGWAGAQTLGSLVGTFGMGMILFGLGAFVHGTIPSALRAIPKAVPKGMPPWDPLTWVYGLVSVA